MAIALIVVFFLMAVISPRSKPIYYIILAFMWVLFSFNVGAPDTANYERVYNVGIMTAYEPLFTGLMFVCRSLHIPFVGFRMIVASLIALFLTLSFKQVEEYKTLAAAIYLVAPFPWQVSGMRAALACVLVMYALTQIIDNDNKNTKKFIIFVLIATLVHYSSIVFLLMLLANQKTSKKRIIVFCAIAVIGTLIVQRTDVLLNFVSSFTSRNKTLIWLSGGVGKAGYPSLNGFIAELLILIGNLFFSNLSRKILNRRNAPEANIAEIIFRFNMISILFVPLLRLNDTFMRLIYVVHGINIILYAMTAFVLQEERTMLRDKTSKWVIKIRLKYSLYAIFVPLWTFIIAYYEALPYFGTPQSVIEFLGDIRIF